MTSADTPHQSLQPAPPQAGTGAAPMERLAQQLGGRAAASAVCGEPVTVDGMTLIPVTDIGFAFAGATGSDAARVGEGGGGGGARLRGYIQIKDGAATYKPVRASWVNVAVPLAALLAGALVPTLVRRLTGRRPR
ncbi:sporulation protein [Streptomyces sp. NPDC052196]|uniref:sporulation protein n=1 Tax=Streptomyces sp. NPDC052196 TaxID=3156691 RepID=UPI003437AA7C